MKKYIQIQIQIFTLGKTRKLNAANYWYNQPAPLEYFSSLWWWRWFIYRSQDFKNNNKNNNKSCWSKRFSFDVLCCCYFWRLPFFGLSTLIPACIYSTYYLFTVLLQFGRVERNNSFLHCLCINAVDENNN